MTRWWSIMLGVIVILLLCCYLIIPGRMIIKESVAVPTNPNGFQRALLNGANWEKWWPGKLEGTKGEKLAYNGHTYTLLEKRLTSLVFSLTGKDSSQPAWLHYVSTGADTVLLQWETEASTSVLPWKRLERYSQMRQLNADFRAILQKARDFFSRPENLYDIPVQQVQVVDSTLIFTSATTQGFPSNTFIYGLIDELKDYSSGQSAKVTGYPMLNVTTTDSVQFTTKVALPVDKKLKSSGNISYRWMLGGGKILVTEVRGGPGAIHRSMERLETFVQDHHFIAPAIPFQSLITDRSKEKDTSKWVTKIYYPIM